MSDWVWARNIKSRYNDLKKEKRKEERELKGLRTKAESSLFDSGVKNDRETLLHAEIARTERAIEAIDQRIAQIDRQVATRGWE